MKEVKLCYTCAKILFEILIGEPWKDKKHKETICYLTGEITGVMECDKCK